MFSQVIQFDNIDSYLGGETYSTASTTASSRSASSCPGCQAQAREFISVELNQSYYTNQNQSVLDRRVSSSQSPGAVPSHFSALALSVRALPTDAVNATIRAEFDPTHRQLKQVSAQGSYSWTTRLQTSAGWTKKAFIEGLLGYDNPNLLDHYVNATANIHTQDNKVGGIYSFNYDVRNSRMTNQRISSFYNRAVLRHRVRVPDLQLRHEQLLTRPAGQPLLHLVHARRPRQLLAAERRAGRRARADARAPASLTWQVRSWSPAPRGFAGSHLLELLAADRARDSLTAVAARSSAGTGPARSARDRRHSLGRGRSPRSRRGRRRHPPSPPAAVYHCAGAAHVGRAWDSVTSTFAVNVRGAPSPRGAACRLAVTGRADPRLGDGLSSVDHADPEDHDLLPPNPCGLSKLAQELLAVRALADGIDVPSGAPSTTSDRARTRSSPRPGSRRQIAEIEAGRREPRIVVGNLSAEREAIDVRDTVRAYRAILERGSSGTPHNVSSGRAYPVGEVVGTADQQIASRGPRARRRSALPSNDIPTLVGDPRASATRSAGRASIPLEQTLDDMLEYWRGQIRWEVLVTGGTGYLGRAVVRALAARGHEHRQSSRGRRESSGLPGVLVNGDVRDRAALEGAAAGCDAISHSAALVEHLAPPPPGFRRCERRWPAERARRRRGAADFARPLHLVVPARSRRAICVSRSPPTTTSGRRSPPTGWPTSMSATAVR